MRSPRWRKVRHDLLRNKARTSLVVLSIALGVFAVGVIAGARTMLQHDMTASYRESAPPSATLFLDPFDEATIEMVRHMPGVAAAEGRNSLMARVDLGGGATRSLILQVVADYDRFDIAKVRSLSGAWPPPKHAALLEHGSLAFLSTAQGADLTIELPSGKRRTLAVAGVVHDVSVSDARLAPFAYGFITLDTLEWLGEAPLLNQLQIVTAERPDDRQHTKAIVDQVRAKLEKGGHTIQGAQIPIPGKHWADDTVQTILLILGVLGALSLLTSCFLVINTLSALLTQQTREIGVMKAIGGRRDQIIGMYLSLVLGFGLLALVIATPLGALGSYLFVGFMAGLFNFRQSGLWLPPGVLALQLAAGLGAPLLGALWPVLAGSRITVREAITSSGVPVSGTGGALDGLIRRLHRVPRPLLLSLRNTFRRRGRLALTLLTLTLAGAMLIAVFSVRESLLQTLDKLYQTNHFDLWVFMNRDYRSALLEREALQTPGVVRAETWGRFNGRRVLADRSKTEQITVVAPPAETELFQPTIIAGRWLLPDDENAVVVAADLLKEEPDLAVGKDLTLEIGGRETRWRIVGVAQVIFARRTIYANQPYAARVTEHTGRSNYMVLVTAGHSGAAQAAVARDLRERFTAAGLQLGATYTVSDDRADIEFQFNILVMFLLAMAALLGAVGGLGLMGTMSINVLERRREIGVMRAIGASNPAILQIVIAEGIMIGVLSWLAAAVLAAPVSALLSQAVGSSLLKAPLDYIFSVGGALIWLVAVIVIAALACFVPAWKAARLTVRDVLSYE